MNDRRQLFRAGYYIGWSILLAALVAIGGHELWIGVHGRFITPGPSATTDGYLEALLQVRDGSKVCSEAIDRVSGPRSIVYFCQPRDASADFVYGVLAYLSWPQKIDKVETTQSALEQKIASIDHGSTSAFAFFDLSAPSEWSGWHIGPHLFIVPRESAP